MRVIPPVRTDGMNDMQLVGIVVLQFVFKMWQYVFVEPFVECVNRLASIDIYQGVTFIHEISVSRDALLICYPCRPETGIIEYRHKRFFIICFLRIKAVGSRHNMRNASVSETRLGVNVVKQHEIIFFCEIRSRLSFIAIDLKMVAAQRLTIAFANEDELNAIIARLS